MVREVQLHCERARETLTSHLFMFRCRSHMEKGKRPSAKMVEM